jgi:hypothetical protein
MSILLSAYYPEGIVFVADKNVTITAMTPVGDKRYVEPTATKVLAWPYKRALVGFVGLGTLAGYPLDEWMRIFIAETRDFEDIESLAHRLQDRVQKDFQQEYIAIEDVSKLNLIIHLGGYSLKEGVAVPVMYHVRNNQGHIDPGTGKYPPAQKVFDISEDIERDLKSSPHYPKQVRQMLQSMIDDGRYCWYCNGANLGAFNVFKEFVWNSLQIIQQHGFAPRLTGLGARIAFCKMSVELFSSYFTHHCLPEDRIVGGGVDAVYAPWPE